MLGISVYPYKERQDDTLAYIDRAADLDYGRLFTNLLAIPDGEKESTLASMRTVIERARERGMEVLLDVSPSVFTQLGLAPTQIGFFKELGATGIRLDQSFDGMVESIMTFDDSGLDVEVNISNDTGYIENILSYAPNCKRLIGCHNFYPQRFTGLDYEYFLSCSRKYKALGMRTAAFIGSQAADHGPHPFADGLCTLELHRDLPSRLQAKHLIATGVIDDVIFANAYASDDELAAVAALRDDQVTFDALFVDGASATERELLLQHQHFCRGDINSYSIRSTFVKLEYANAPIPPANTPDVLHPGDITVGNDTFGQYKGELALVKQEMPNTGHHKNLVARIPEAEHVLVPFVGPWSKFRFVEGEGA